MSARKLFLAILDAANNMRRSHRDDYLTRIEETRRRLTWVAPADGGCAVGAFMRNREKPFSEREEDISEEVRILCEYADISMRMWKALDTRAMIDYAAALRRLKASDCKECGCHAPYHRGHCSIQSGYVLVGGDN